MLRHSNLLSRIKSLISLHSQEICEHNNMEFKAMAENNGHFFDAVADILSRPSFMKVSEGDAFVQNNRFP